MVINISTEERSAASQLRNLNRRIDNGDEALEPHIIFELSNLRYALQQALEQSGRSEVTTYDDLFRITTQRIDGSNRNPLSPQEPPRKKRNSSDLRMGENNCAFRARR